MHDGDIFKYQKSRAQLYSFNNVTLYEYYGSGVSAVWNRSDFNKQIVINRTTFPTVTLVSNILSVDD